jgi:hypothetical protein
MKYCVVQSNRCLGLDGVNTGGGIYTDYNGGANIGGGSGTRYGFVDLRNCIVSSNDCSGYTQTYGGGIYAFNASLAMTNSIVCGNATSSSANLQAGGGIYLNSSVQSASIINCTKSGPHSLDHETQKLS